MGDTYADPIYAMLADQKRIGAGPSTCDLGAQAAPGETPNHYEQRLAAAAMSNPASVRSIVLDYYGAGIRRIGNQAKGGDDEGFLSKSHWAHYGAARGPLLYAYLRAGDREVTRALAAVWKGDLAGAKELMTPQGTIVGPGARFTDDADQRAECNATFGYLLGRKVRMPDTLSSAPTWLALYMFTLLDKAAAAGEGWAQPWPELLKGIRAATRADILPLKNPLVVERTKTGHLARYLKTDKMLLPADWACAEYGQREVITYGSTAQRPGARDLLVGHPAPKCPGGPGEVFAFPVANPNAK